MGYVNPENRRPENHKFCYECGEPAYYKAGSRGFCRSHKEHASIWQEHEDARKTDQWHSEERSYRKMREAKTNPLAIVYKSMISRCTYASGAEYHRYGGRGITVCDEWRNSQDSFLSWATSSGYESGLEIDRIDNDGNYEPSNCRWVTSMVNTQNSSNARVTPEKVAGIKKKLAAGISRKTISKEYGVSDGIIYSIWMGRTWTNIAQEVHDDMFVTPSPHTTLFESKIIYQLSAEQVIPVDPKPYFKGNTTHIKIVQGGFMDDKHVWHKAPKRIKEAFRIKGIWYWASHVRDNHGKLLLSDSLLSSAN